MVRNHSPGHICGRVGGDTGNDTRDGAEAQSSFAPAGESNDLVVCVE